MSEVTDQFIVDAEYNNGDFIKDHLFAGQDVISARSVLQIDDPDTNALIWEAGAEGNGCILFLFGNKIYFKGGNGSTFIDGQGSVEVSTAEITSPGQYEVEISYSAAANRAAIFLDGIQQDVSGPSDGSLLNPVAGGNELAVGTLSGGFGAGANGVCANRYAEEGANDFSSTEAGPQAGSFVEPAIQVFAGQSIFDINPAQDLRMRLDFAQSRTDNGRLRDRSGYDNHFAIQGGPSFGDPSPPIGEAVQTQGTTTFSRNRIRGSGDSVTVAGWFWIQDASTNDSTVMAKDQSWQARFEPSGMAFDNFQDLEFLQEETASIFVTLPEQEWVHLAWVYSEGGVFRALKSGELVGSSTDLGFPLADKGDTVTIASAVGGTEPFDGRVADLRVYNRPLTEASVNRIRNERSLTSKIAPGPDNSSGVGT